MNSIQKIEKLESFLKQTSELAADVGAYDLKKVIAMANEFLRRLPFQVGGKVVLAKELNLTEDNGWFIYRNFLKPGVVGVIKDVDFYNDQVVLGLSFKGLTYYSDFFKKEVPEHENGEKTVFYFKESDVLPLKE